MDYTRPFKPAANCFLVMASTPAPVPTLSSGVPGMVSYLIYNQSSVWDVFVSNHALASTALSNAVVPLIGTGQPVIPVGRGTSQMFTFTGRSWFTAITPTGGQARVYIVPGDGE